jgi:hypothetical protein
MPDQKHGACSAGSEGSISDSSVPGSTSPSSARPTTGDGESLPAGSPEPASTPTSPPSTEPDGQLFSSEGFLAKTSVSPAAGAGSPERAARSSSSSRESQTLWSGPEGGSFSKTYPDSFPHLAQLQEMEEMESTGRAGTSPSFSRRWPTSGFTTSRGECWTADTPEYPSDGDGSTSLVDVLEEIAHERFFLSPKAAAGILSRAGRRGRSLPEALRAALAALVEETTTEPTREP